MCAKKTEIVIGCNGLNTLFCVRAGLSQPGSRSTSRRSSSRGASSSGASFAGAVTPHQPARDKRAGDETSQKEEASGEVGRCVLLLKKKLLQSINFQVPVAQFFSGKLPFLAHKCIGTTYVNHSLNIFFNVAQFLPRFFFNILSFYRPVLLKFFGPG